MHDTSFAGRSIVIEVRSDNFEPSLTVVKPAVIKKFLGLQVLVHPERVWQGVSAGQGATRVVVPYPTDGDSLQVQVSARVEGSRGSYRLAAWDRSRTATNPLAPVPIDIRTFAFRDTNYPLSPSCGHVLGLPGQRVRVKAGTFSQNGIGFVVDTVLFANLTSATQPDAVVLAHCGPFALNSPTDTVRNWHGVIYVISGQNASQAPGQEPNVNLLALVAPPALANESEWIERVVVADRNLVFYRPFASDSVSTRVYAWNAQEFLQVRLQTGPQLLLTGRLASPALDPQARPVTGERWFGLYSADPSDSAYALAEVSLTVKAAPECASAGPAIEIDADHEGSPLLLLSGVRGLHVGPVTTIQGRRLVLRPGRALAFSVNSVRYRLSTTRSSQGYVLTLAAGSRSDLIIFNHVPEVRWIGDLDRDGGPDVLVVTDEDWRLLFLEPLGAASPPGSGTSLLRMMAFLHSASC